MEQWRRAEEDAVAAYAQLLRSTLPSTVVAGLRLLQEDHRQVIALLGSLDPTSPVRRLADRAGPPLASAWTPALASNVTVPELLSRLRTAEKSYLARYEAHASDFAAPARALSLLRSVILPRQQCHPEQIERMLEEIQRARTPGDAPGRSPSQG